MYFTFYFSNFSIKICFLTKPLTSGVFLATLLIFFSKYDPSFSYLVLETNPVVSMLFTLETNLSYSVFFTTSFFTTLLNLAKALGNGTNLSISNLPTSDFKLAKFDFNANLLASICDIILNQSLLHN